MMRLTPKTWASRFRNEERGSVMVEAVITLPLLIWAVGATYEFFELYRYNSARDKASYTIADMISRENAAITPLYIDNAKIVFDTIANDRGANSLRVSVVKFDSIKKRIRRQVERGARHRRPEEAGDDRRQGRI